MTSDRPRLLFVCHANICRSPMAERLTRMTLTDPARARIDAASAGTHARIGESIHPGAVRALRELGADAAAFASRRLSADLVADASLVLTATRQQRAICVTLSAPAVDRTFTIRQFGRLAAAVDPAHVTGTTPAHRLVGLLDGVASVRGVLQPVPPEDDDLADPVDGTDADMRACAGQIQASLRPVLALIAVP